MFGLLFQASTRVSTLLVYRPGVFRTMLKRRLSVTNLSSENNVVSTECSSRHQGESAGKLFSELELVTDNLLFIYAEATE